MLSSPLAASPRATRRTILRHLLQQRVEASLVLAVALEELARYRHRRNRRSIIRVIAEQGGRRLRRAWIGVAEALGGARRAGGGAGTGTVAALADDDDAGAQCRATDEFELRASSSRVCKAPVDTPRRAGFQPAPQRLDRRARIHRLTFVPRGGVARAGRHGGGANGDGPALSSRVSLARCARIRRNGLEGLVARGFWLPAVASVASRSEGLGSLVASGPS